MRARFDPLARQISRAALARGRLVYTHQGVVSDGRTAAIWFLPDPACDAERVRLGLLGRMTEGATMLAPFLHTPGINELRDCVHRQLAIDRSRVAEAQKEGDPRPPFPRLWVLSTGRPESVIKGYDFKPMPGWPEGFLEGREADRVGLVVLRELPRERSTLPLRLMGVGAVLTEAIADVTALPGDAWERRLAIPVLDLRFEIALNAADDEERTYLMITTDLYDQWKHAIQAQGFAEGLAQGLSQGFAQAFEAGLEKGLKQSLVTAYRVRFGALPADLAAVIEATHEVAVLSTWLERIVTGTREEIAAALRSGSAPST
jgi:hypothetical protein